MVIIKRSPQGQFNTPTYRRRINLVELNLRCKVIFMIHFKRVRIANAQVGVSKAAVLQSIANLNSPTKGWFWHKTVFQPFKLLIQKQPFSSSPHPALVSLATASVAWLRWLQNNKRARSAHHNAAFIPLCAAE
jgi:hypothetical protein